MTQITNESRFLLNLGEGPVGPFTLDQLAHAIATGVIRRNHYVAPVGGSHWLPATRLPFFHRLTPRFHDWLACIVRHPGSCGAKGGWFVVAMIPATMALVVVTGVLMAAWIGPGRYQVGGFAIPGILLALGFMYLYGFIVFKLPHRIAIVVSAALALSTAALAYRLLDGIWSYHGG